MTHKEEIEKEANEYANTTFNGLATTKDKKECVEDFTAGVNSKVAEKIREETAIGFAMWLTNSVYVYHTGQELYQLYLTHLNEKK